GGRAVIGRCEGAGIDGVGLPRPAATMRLATLGRWLLARPTVGDSAWVVDLPVKRLVGSVATAWRVDLPAIAPDGSLLVRQRDDVAAYRPDSLLVTGRVKGGGADHWTLTAWRPRGSYRSAFADESGQPGQPAAGDRWWAEAAAWDVARAEALHGRRVALVDLWIEDPTLHEVVGLSPTEGIVDAFEYGVSLTKTAHEVDHVFFIAAGAYTAHPGELFGHERWKKLHGGFRVEGALLLLYLSAGGLARLSAVPDGLIVLSPDGFEPESSIGQGITAALERGIPLVGVVREPWTPPPGPA